MRWAAEHRSHDASRYLKPRRRRFTFRLPTMNWYSRAVRLSACLLAAALVAGCSASKDVRRVPAPLVDFKPKLQVKQAWVASVGSAGRYLFQPIAVGNAVYAAGANGSVAKFDATTGRPVWEVKLKPDLSAGVGSDGTLTAVGAVGGRVLVLGDDGKLLWQADAGGEIVTPPLVGHGYVLVRTIDGKVTAFNAQTGEQKWVYRNRAIPLNLRTTSGMIFAGPTAVLAGFPGGALAALNLDVGDDFWQTPVSFPKGVTEVERINDVAGAPTLVGRQVCAVTFQGRIGCFDAESGRPSWEQPFSSYGGLAANAERVVAADDWSVVTAYDAQSGKQLWQNTQLKSRDLGGPTLVGQAVAVGDYKGYVHFLSLDDGEFIARVPTDGSRIVAPPVLAGGALIVQTGKGRVFAFRPQ